MPMLDMPLAELHKYQGRNPRPADFDAYWERALEEMRSVDAAPRFKRVEHPATFAECFELSWNGVRGGRLRAKAVRPKHAEGPTPALVKTHGYTWRSGDWFDHLVWAAQGIAVFAIDCRGQAGDSAGPTDVLASDFHGHIVSGLREGPDALRYRSIFLDVAQLCGIVLDTPGIDQARVAIEGGSQGGALALVGAALEPRVAFCWANYPFLCDYQRVWEMDLAKGAYQGIRDWFRVYDPLHEREAHVWETLGYVDVQHLAPRIRAEVTMVTGLMDDICPPSTQFAAYNKIASPKQVIVYPDFGHENLHGVNDRCLAWLTEKLLA